MFSFIQPRLVIVALVLVMASLPGIRAFAASPADPYADAVASSTLLIVNPNQALGQPNGNYATVVGISDQLVLDMGAGEEGTGNLKVYFGDASLAVGLTVKFLDASQNTIASKTIALADIQVGTHTAIIPYATALGPYRYVSLGGLVQAITVDAVEAVSYVGQPATPTPTTPTPTTPTADTDGDELPNNWEQNHNLDPNDATGINGANGEP